jgi:hypothetical protein
MALQDDAVRIHGYIFPGIASQLKIILRPKSWAAG